MEDSFQTEIPADLRAGYARMIPIQLRVRAHFGVHAHFRANRIFSGEHVPLWKCRQPGDSTPPNISGRNSSPVTEYLRDARAARAGSRTRRPGDSTDPLGIVRPVLHLQGLYLLQL